MWLIETKSRMFIALDRKLCWINLFLFTNKSPKNSIYIINPDLTSCTHISYCHHLSWWKVKEFWPFVNIGGNRIVKLFFKIFFDIDNNELFILQLRHNNSMTIYHDKLSELILKFITFRLIFTLSRIIMMKNVTHPFSSIQYLLFKKKICLVVS